MQRPGLLRLKSRTKDLLHGHPSFCVQRRESSSQINQQPKHLRGDGHTREGQRTVSALTPKQQQPHRSSSYGQRARQLLQKSSCWFGFRVTLLGLGSAWDRQRCARARSAPSPPTALPTNTQQMAMRPTRGRNRAAVTLHFIAVGFLLFFLLIEKDKTEKLQKY